MVTCAPSRDPPAVWEGGGTEDLPRCRMPGPCPEHPVVWHPRGCEGVTVDSELHPPPPAASQLLSVFSDAAGSLATSRVVREAMRPRCHYGLI